MNNSFKIFLDFPTVWNSRQKTEGWNDEQNVPNGWTVKDGGVGGEISIVFKTVGKSRKILQKLFKNRALTDKLLY